MRTGSVWWQFGRRWYGAPLAALLFFGCGADPEPGKPGSTFSSSDGGAGGTGAIGGFGGAEVPSGGGNAGTGGPNIHEPQGTSLLIQVLDTGNNPIPSVAITALEDGAMRMTDGAGYILYENLTPGRFSARVEQWGYTPVSAVVDLPKDAHGGLKVHMAPLSPRLAFDANVGAVLDQGPVHVTIPPNAIVDENGKPFTGIAEATIVPLDPSTGMRELPGTFDGVTNGGAFVGLDSLFMAEVTLWNGPYRLQIAPGTTATLEFVLPDTTVSTVQLGQTIPAWSFDLNTGMWHEDGVGSIQPSMAESGKTSWIGLVEHFTWWGASNVLPPERHCYNVHVVDAMGSGVSNKQVSVIFPGYTYIRMTDGTGHACIEIPIGETAEIRVGPPGNPNNTTIVTGMGPASYCGGGGAACVPLEISQFPLLCTPGEQHPDPCPPYTGPPGTENVGNCKAKSNRCDTDGMSWTGCVGEVLPQPESCQTLGDENCDGVDPCGPGCDDGVKNNNETDIDCGPGCLACPTGKSCNENINCESVVCVDGVCCNEACDGTCQACTFAKTGESTGTCAPIPVGADPDNECNVQDPSTCGNMTGACNGTNGCQLYPAGTACGAIASCINAVETFADLCDGQGTCVIGGTTSCSPYACNGATCGQTCTNDSNCDASSYCVNGVCKPKGNDGDPCQGANQCASGSCVDGVCCNSACGGGAANDCQACNLPGSVGTCTPIAAGTVCRASSGACDVTETCDGSALDCPVDGVASANTECRTSAGACDVAEACDGNTKSCPTDGFVAPGTECRAANGVCDVAEACTGSSAACPNDDVLPSGTMCRSSAGACDIAETCDGSTKSCPADGFVATGTECRAANGGCDVAETCTGSSAACPNDDVLPSGTTCRASAGACDIAETCDGSAKSCPIDKFVATGTECRTANGVCDVAEKCTGASAQCPVDSVKPTGTVCRNSLGNCDLTETCDGSAKDCPQDKLVAAGTTCRGSMDACDAAETCTGSDPVCPPDLAKPAGTTCRASAGVCDVAEVCNGSAMACPPDGFVSTGTVCRFAIGACDSEEKCTGSSASCPPDGVKPPGTICRAPAGACDLQETCDGITKTCPVDTLAPTTTVCRPATDVCDIAERCTGSSVQCPADSVQPTGTVCRNSAGVCDVTETCNGSAKTCPTDIFLPATTVCRSATDVCDVAESCTGTTAACPVDAVKTAGTTCRASAGACDVAESCNGSAKTCPTDIFLPATTVCRSATDVCDVAESCTGIGPACPADTVRANGYVCRGSAGTCDVAETCNGSLKTCPTDVFLPATTVCRSATDVCDVAESCTGTTAACPVDAVKPAGTTCRASAGGCDVVESCNGSTKACPADGFVAAGTTCRPASDVCDNAETCTGSTPACPADAFKSAGTVCRPAVDTCDAPETCSGSSVACPANQFATAGTICGNEFCSSPTARNNLDACDGAGTCFNGGSTNCPSGCLGSTCLTGPITQPVSGVWHNPARPGWSVHISRNTQDPTIVLLIWLTYRPNGTPVWYFAETTQTNGKFATSQMYNCTWNNGCSVVFHGSMTLTTASATSGVISWVLDGVAWQEPVQLYTFDTSGMAPSITGSWYDANEPGWGIGASVQGDSLVSTYLGYDVNNQPTWVHQSGSSIWNGSAFNATLAKRTGVNLCPGCAGATSYSSADVGTMVLHNFYDTDGDGLLDWGKTDISFTAASGLSPWSRSNLTLSRLTL